MVRLYRSPSPAKRRFRDNDASSTEAAVATKSPMCGAGVLGKIRGVGRSHQSNTTTGGSSTGSTARSSSPVNGLETEYISVHHPRNTKKNLFQGGPAYESFGNSSEASIGRQSSESTESTASAASSRRGDEAGDESSPYHLQFEPDSGAVQATKNEDSGKQSGHHSKHQSDRLQTWVDQQRQKRATAESSQENEEEDQASSDASQTQMLQIRPRGHMWSTNLPVVKEEQSFEGEDGSLGESPKNHRGTSSPDRNQMLLAMRQIILKQQTAIAEVSDENQMYRMELKECRKLLQLAKEAYTKQQKLVESLNLEKESSDAEVVWLREEVKTLRAEIFKHQESATKPWTSSRSSEEVEERLRKARAETPPRRRKSHLENNNHLAASSPKATSPKPLAPRETTSPVPARSMASPTRDIVSPTPPSPMTSPIQSPRRDWTLKNILPAMSYLSDEADSDDELMKEVKDLRTTISNSGISTKELHERIKLEENIQQVERRDDHRGISPEMWLNEEEARYPDDEMRDMPSPFSPPPMRDSQDVSSRKRSNLRSPRASPLSPRSSHENAPLRSNLRSPRANSQAVLLESKRPPSSVPFNDSVTSDVAQKQREEVALFKSRLDAIQKKREQRKQLEENVGSRSGRVRFT